MEREKEILPLMPINKCFLEVFDTFMDENQKIKIRANSVRQYIKGIIDLLLKDKIISILKPNEIYEGVNWKRKIKIIKDHYDSDIGNTIEYIFRIGGDGSHFNGKVNGDDLCKIVDKSIHIVEDIFVKYFLSPKHKFGTENIYTIFSMLPLHHRIYILEQLTNHYINSNIVDRLSLAYVKSDQLDKAIHILKKSLKEGVIHEEFYKKQIEKINILYQHLEELYKVNENYTQSPEKVVALIRDDQIIVGVPTSKDVFETAKAVEVCKDWFEITKAKYPEFVNLFLYLMMTDSREYK